MARLRWTKQAVEDVESICEYSSRDSGYFGRVFADRVMEQASVLESFPRAGRTVPESHNDHIREILYGNYRIIYRELKDTVEILTVHHSARELHSDNIEQYT